MKTEENNEDEQGLAFVDLGLVASVATSGLAARVSAKLADRRRDNG